MATIIRECKQCKIVRCIDEDDDLDCQTCGEATIKYQLNEYDHEFDHEFDDEIYD